MDPQEPPQQPPYQQPPYQQQSYQQQSYQQQSYQQPPYQQPPYQPAPAGSARWGTSSLGNLGADIMSGLAYLIVLIPIVGFILQIVLFAVEKNRFVKFHAAQAMILSIAWYALGIVSAIVSSVFTAGANANVTIISALSGGVGALFGCVFFLLGVGIFALWIWGMVAGFTGKATKLPVAGDFAQSLAGGPLTA